MSSATQSNYLTASDVSRLAAGRITPSGVRTAAARGKLRVALRTAGGIHLFAREDVEQWLATRPQRRGAAA